MRYSAPTRRSGPGRPLLRVVVLVALTATALTAQRGGNRGGGHGGAMPEVGRGPGPAGGGGGRSGGGREGFPALHGPEPGRTGSDGRQSGQRPNPRRPLGASLGQMRQLPPGAREQQLRQDPAFQQLPPERQEQVMNRLRWFNALPPGRQQKVLERLQVLGRLSPEQRSGLEAIFPGWKGLELGRRRAVLGAYRNLHAMTPEKREQRFNNPKFQARFAPGEIELLRGTLALDLPDEVVRPGPPLGPGENEGP